MKNLIWQLWQFVRLVTTGRVAHNCWAKKYEVRWLNFYWDHILRGKTFGPEDVDQVTLDFLEGRLPVEPATPEEILANRYILEFPENFPIGVEDASNNETDKPELKSANPVIVVRDWLDWRRAGDRDKLSAEDDTDSSS
jgi:hypothetical protein